MAESEEGERLNRIRPKSLQVPAGLSNNIHSIADTVRRIVQQASLKEELQEGGLQEREEEERTKEEEEEQHDNMEKVEWLTTLDTSIKIPTPATSLDSTTEVVQHSSDGGESEAGSGEFGEEGKADTTGGQLVVLSSSLPLSIHNLNRLTPKWQFWLTCVKISVSTEKRPEQVTESFGFNLIRPVPTLHFKPDRPVLHSCMTCLI